MEHDFYKGRLADKFGLEVIVPDSAGRQTVHDVIYRELCLGQIRKDSKDSRSNPGEPSR
jgi:aspartate racemase